MKNAFHQQKLKSYLAALKPSWGGRLIYRFFPFKKEVVLKNMQIVFGKVLSEEEIIKLAKCYYSHLLLVMKEFLYSSLMPLSKVKQKIEVVGKEHLWNLLDLDAKGVAMLTGHFGNWELGGMGFGLNLYPIKELKGERNVYILRKSLRNKWAEKLLFRNFNRTGIKIIRKEQALEQVRKVLKKNNIAIFVLDQHACLKVKDGVAVDFFGKKAGTFQSLAVLTRHLKNPIIPIRSFRRHSDGKQIIECFPPISWIKHEDVKEEIALNTRQYNEILEQFVLDYPEQWNWMHRRWRDI